MIIYLPCQPCLLSIYDKIIWEGLGEGWRGLSRAEGGGARRDPGEDLGWVIGGKGGAITVISTRSIILRQTCPTLTEEEVVFRLNVKFGQSTVSDNYVAVKPK